MCYKRPFLQYSYMATDSVRLFNKTRAEELLAKGEDISQAFENEEIYLDYWGSYAKVFSQTAPVGAISSYEYLPDEEEELFLLLRAEHLDQIIKSLNKHSSNLDVMKKEDIRQLQSWKNLCAQNSNYLVAYLFDF